MIYLDNAATTPVTKPVLDAMLPYFSGFYGNPSSQHKAGKVAKAAVKEAREKFAKAINAEPEQIFFTSGATESNNLIARNYDVISSVYEHPSMQTKTAVANKAALETVLLIYINGRKIEGTLRDAVRKSHKNTVVSWQAVNSEIGTIYPIQEIVRLTHSVGALFHSDMTQAFGHIPIDVKDIDCDFASFSGHKFHAPKGIGVLYIKEPKKFNSDIIGGGQEFGLRSGTENVPGIVGIGEAAKQYNYNCNKSAYISRIRDKIISMLDKKMPCKFKINQPDVSVPNIISISIQGVEGETVMQLLNMKEICVSTGSACHSNSLDVSPTIKMLDLPEDYVHGTIRISFEALTDDDIEFFTNELARICGILTDI